MLYTHLQKIHYQLTVCCNLAWFQKQRYSKTCLKPPLPKRPKDQKLVFKTNYRLMQVKRSILQYFQPSLRYHLSLRSLFCLFLSGRFTQVLLYSKTRLKQSLSKRPELVSKTNYGLMQVKSIAECSKGSILQYFPPSLSYHLSLRSLFCLFLSGCLRQVFLYRSRQTKFCQIFYYPSVLTFVLGALNRTSSMRWFF